MNKWRETTLSDICIDISYGYTTSAKEEPVGPKFLRITDIVSDMINWETVPYCDANCKIIEKYKLENGDIVIARTGATTGYNKIIKKINFDAVFASYLIRYKIDTNKACPFFIGYILQSSNWYDYVDAIIGGSAQPGVNAKQFGNYKILLPPLPEQHAIASVLSSLDDKIDLLHRQNKTLEQMAEALFRQWFVVEADDGWEEVPLGNSDLATIIQSGINYFEGEKIYLATGDVDNTDIKGGTPITFKNRPSRANMEPTIYSVWFAKKGGVRKLLMFDNYSYGLNDLILSTGFTGLKTTELSHYYIWCYITSTEFQEIKDSFVSGTVQLDINNDSLNQIMIPKPDNKILLKFNEIVKEFFFKISFNQQQILTLEKLRDTLLPKLMSGEIRVKI